MQTVSTGEATTGQPSSDPVVRPFANSISDNLDLSVDYKLDPSVGDRKEFRLTVKQTRNPISSKEPMNLVDDVFAMESLDVV